MSAKVLSLEFEVREMKIKKAYVEQVNDISDKNENRGDTEINEKVKWLEDVGQKMFLNVIKLEAKVKVSPTIPKGKVISEETDKNRQESYEKEDNTNKKVYSFGGKKDKGKQEVDLKCDMCEYTCKKRNKLTKHMNIKHSDHTCKIGNKVFPNSMDALVHTATDHTNNIMVIKNAHPPPAIL